VGAARAGALSGSDQVLSFDMGGTSCDVAVIDGGVIRQSSEQEIDVHEGLENTLIMLHYRLKYGIRVIREYDTSAPRGVAGRNSDNTQIRELLGWEPSTPLLHGLEATYRWIYDQMRASVTGPDR